MTPQRIQISRKKGWRKPQGAVVVARPSIWGNPFCIGSRRGTGNGETYLEEMVKDAETSVRFFREMLEYQWRPYPQLSEIILHLRGKDLCCWCRLDQPCHADVLLALANEGRT